MSDKPKLEINGNSSWQGLGVGHGTERMNSMGVIRTQKDWENLWEFGRGCFTPHDQDLTPGKLPEGAMAIAMFVPGVVASGYDLQIRKIEDGANRITVDWFLMPPTSSSTDTSSCRYNIRLIPFSDKGVEFRQVPPPLPSPGRRGPQALTP